MKADLTDTGAAAREGGQGGTVPGKGGTLVMPVKGEKGGTVPVTGEKGGTVPVTGEKGGTAPKVSLDRGETGSTGDGDNRSTSAEKMGFISELNKGDTSVWDGDNRGTSGFDKGGIPGDGSIRDGDNWGAFGFDKGSTPGDGSVRDGDDRGTSRSDKGGIG